MIFYGTFQKTEENNRFTFKKLSFVLKKPARRIPFEIRV